MVCYNNINVTLDVYSIVINIIIIASILWRRKKADLPSKWFGITCFFNILFAISDIFTWISEGTNAKWKFIALPLSNCLYYILGFAIFLTYLQYIVCYYSRFSKVSNIYKYLSFAVTIFYLSMVILNFKFNIFYSISEDNIYSRGNYYWISVIIDLIFYVEILIIVLTNMKSVPGHQTVAFCSFIFIPLITFVIQVFNYGISLNGVGITLSFFIIFINLINRLEDNLDKTNSELKQKNQQIINLQDNTIISLSNLVENRDTDTGHHVRRTRDYVTLIAEQCKKDHVYSETINDTYIVLLSKSAPLHDVGKIIVPDYVLKKPGKLTDEEFKHMQKHAKQGGKIINDVLGFGVDPEYLRIATEISTGHHERWDGRGYPYKLVGNAIPLSARIMAIADVFDALVSKRCYKDSMPIDKAFTIIQEESGSHFDPILVEEFFKIKDDIAYVVERFSD